jgi:hypothetical protein
MLFQIKRIYTELSCQGPQLQALIYFYCFYFSLFAQHRHPTILRARRSFLFPSVCLSAPPPSCSLSIPCLSPSSLQLLLRDDRRVISAAHRCLRSQSHLPTQGTERRGWLSDHPVSCPSRVSLSPSSTTNHHHHCPPTLHRRRSFPPLRRRYYHNNNGRRRQDDGPSALGLTATPKRPSSQVDCPQRLPPTLPR